MKIKLKPQWLFRTSPEVSLTSETMYHPRNSDEASLLQRLVEGIDLSDMQEDILPQIEALTNEGFLTFVDHPYLAAYELHVQNFKYVQEQLKHLTFSITGSSKWATEEYLHRVLIEGGMIEDKNPKLRILIADSFLELADSDTPAMPVVVGRARISLGPLILPWKAHIRDLTKMNEKYMPAANYSFPRAFIDLGNAWVATNIIQFAIISHMKYVNHIFEYDMLTQETKKWLVQT